MPPQWASSFLARSAVFTTAEFAKTSPAGSDRTPASLLAYHVARGHVVRVRRGLYAVVPPGVSPAEFLPDPTLVAARAAPDAVVAYATALEVHGWSASVHSRAVFLTGTAARAFAFRGTQYVPVRPPTSDRRRGHRRLDGATNPHAPHLQIVRATRGGTWVYVTSPERSFVDALARPDLCGGEDEVARSLTNATALNLHTVVEYATELLCDREAARRTALALERRREELGVRAEHLDALRRAWRRAPVAGDGA